MFDVPMRNTTIPHEVIGKFESSSVLLKPASEGTGVIAGGGVRAVLELAGVRDVLTKALGSTTSVNLVQATVEGLQRLRSKADIEQTAGGEDNAMSPAKLKVTQIRSVIGSKQDHKRTVRALGLKRIRDSRVHEDTPQIRGMVHKVQHLVQAEEVD